MLTAGFGRVADFEYLHTAEIQNLLTVNTVSIIKIIRLFYDRINTNEDFIVVLWEVLQVGVVHQCFSICCI